MCFFLALTREISGLKSNFVTGRFYKNIHFLIPRGRPRRPGPAGSQERHFPAQSHLLLTMCCFPHIPQAAPCTCPGQSLFPTRADVYLARDNHRVYALSLPASDNTKPSARYRTLRISSIPKTGRPINGHDNKLTKQESQGWEGEPTMSPQL